MLIIIVGLLFIGLCLATAEVTRSITTRKRYGITLRQMRELSGPSRRLMKEYYILDDKHKPHGDLYPMLTALDTKYRDENITSHFRSYGYEGESYFTWNCHHMTGATGNKNCPLMPEYRNLHVEIDAIKKAARAQENALEISKHEHELGAVEDFTQRLRDERKLIDDVTKELT